MGAACRGFPPLAVFPLFASALASAFFTFALEHSSFIVVVSEWAVGVFARAFAFIGPLVAGVVRASGCPLFSLKCCVAISICLVVLSVYLLSALVFQPHFDDLVKVLVVQLLSVL